jgi:hypothetical protein
VFDFERWKKHRSSSRYLRHVLGLGESKIVSVVSCWLTCASGWENNLYINLHANKAQD